MGLGSRTWTTAVFLSSLDGPIVRFPNRLGGTHCAALALHCIARWNKAESTILSIPYQLSLPT